MLGEFKPFAIAIFGFLLALMLLAYLGRDQGSDNPVSDAKIVIERVMTPFMPTFNNVPKDDSQIHYAFVGNTEEK